MLSIAKLRVGQEAYQLSGVAQSLDDYYTGAGEASGVWLGGGAGRLRLDGEVAPEDLRAVLAGLAPGWGGLTPNGTEPRGHPRRVPGFDLTFKAPKSASVLYAVSDDPSVQGTIIEAGEAAARAALGWLEREAIRVRRGSHNQAWLAAHSDEQGPRQLSTSGVVAASFRHRTSRAGDPLLHWHVLVANMAEGTDGRWSALYGSELYRHARAAGEVFQAVFRDELSASLGVEWRPGRHVPEIAGIPQAVLDRFSKRSADVEAWLAAKGTPDNPAGRQAAVLATRRHKPEVEHGRFDESWKAEATDAGWGPDAAERLVGWSQQRAGRVAEGAWRLDAIVFDEDGRAERVERVVDADEWIADLLRTELTASTSTFTDTDLVRAVAARQGQGATIETIERIAARVVASEQVVALASDEHGRRWTSRELFDVESRFLAAVVAPAHCDSLPVGAIEAAIADHPSLGDDQLAALYRITTDPHPVAVLVGPAGTGKTFTLDAVRAAFEHAGHAVLGAAPSARAALELTDGAGISARTLHSLLDRWERGHEAPVRDTLLVIDEAGMADIRTLEALVSRQVALGGRVLLAGDHHQLPEVSAGGGFAAAVTGAACVAELSVNRRQHHAWEQDALTELRHGSVAGAVAAYLEHDRVIVADNAEAMIAAAVGRWFAARDAGQSPVLLAGTNDLVDRLNAAVVERLVERGELKPDAVGFGSGVFRVGERVVVRRNSTETTTCGRPVDIANGHHATVIGAAADGLVVRLNRGGEELVLTDSYLQRGGHLTHAYALTTHRAQGGTWDLAIAVGTEGLYREGAYVQLSRGATANWLVLTEPQAAELRRESALELQRHDAGLIPVPDEPPEAADELIERLGRSRAKHLARTADPDAPTVERLARTVSLPELERRRVAATTAERIATDSLGFHADELLERLTYIDHLARHLTLGSRVSPTDRHNVGTVVGLNDAAGRVTVAFVSGDGREATRDFHWHELRVLDPTAPPRTLSPTAERHLDALTVDVSERMETWRESVRRLGAEPGDADRYGRAIDRHVEQRAETLAADRPAWLSGLLGARPDDVAGANAWDDAVRDLVRWRARLGLDADTPGLGARPASSSDAGEWDVLQARVGLTRTWLATTDRIEAADTIVPSAAELLERRGELDELFTHVPPDWRATIRQLQNGQLSLDDTAELLGAALEGQEARRQWILAKWPHVVEYQEINRTLTTATWGPDPRLLTDLLTEPLTDALSRAITNNEPWLRVALCVIADGDTTELDEGAVAWLSELAEDRATPGIEPRAPLRYAWFNHAPPERAVDLDADLVDVGLDW
jgi:conjugative relaxase-like TrwC/TraI family protein